MERRSLYEQFSDHIIYNHTSIEDAVTQILTELEK
jgi:hypothetical protein